VNHDDFDPDDDIDPIIAALRDIGRSMLPPGFDDDLRTYDQLMQDVHAARARAATRRCPAATLRPARR
jgi:hypothetical protein